MSLDASMLLLLLPLLGCWGAGSIPALAFAFLKIHDPDPNPKSLLVEKASKSMKYLFKWVMEAVI